jgi:ATP-dependent Clp protease, protease subunit
MRSRNQSLEPVDLFIYGDIGASWFDENAVTASAVAIALKQIPKNQPINLRINSSGGDVGEGLAIYNQLSARRSQITTYIDGYALSAASFIALAGSKVISPEASIWMLHNPHSIAFGDSSAMRKTADALDTHRDAILAIYVDRTGQDAAVITETLDAETWFTGAEAKEFGLADELSEAAPISNRLPQRFAASADKEKLAHLGWQFAAKAIALPHPGLKVAAHKALPIIQEEDMTLEKDLQEAQARIKELESAVTNGAGEKQQIEARAIAAETELAAIKAKFEDSQKRQATSDRYYALRQRAENLVSNLKLSPAEFAEDFTTSASGDIENLIKSGDSDITFAVLDKSLARAEKRSAALPTKTESLSAEGVLEDPHVSDRAAEAKAARERAAAKYKANSAR